MIQAHYKRRIPVDALRLTTENRDEALRWMGLGATPSTTAENVVVHTLSGDLEARPGDWILEGVTGDFHPCPHEVFVASYDPVASDVMTRVRLERDELLARFRRLQTYLALFDEITDEDGPHDLSLLRRQALHMEGYLAILGERIAKESQPVHDETN